MFRMAGKRVEAVDYPELHFRSRLVGEGHGKDMPVGVVFLALKHQQPYVFAGKGEGLA